MRRADTPLAEAYSTPLMISIARTSYQRLGGDPADQKRYESRLAVENALLDRVVDAAYPAGGVGKPSRWTAQRARRYLTSLAQLLHRSRERDLLWWRMPERVLSGWIALYVGLAAGTVMLICSTVWIFAFASSYLDVAIVLGSFIGVAFGLLATFVWYAGSNAQPGRLSIARRGSAARLRRGFGAGAALGTLLGVPTAAAVTIAISLLREWSEWNSFAFLVLETRAWFRFQVMRFFLAVRRELPWRVADFLEDARSRDLLRHSAGAYQFRHVRLQERLADERAAGPQAVSAATRTRRRVRAVLLAGAASVLMICVTIPLAIEPSNDAYRTLPLAHDADSDGNPVLSPTGTTLAAASGAEVDIWRLPSADRVARISGYFDRPSYSFDGALLYLDGEDDRPDLILRADIDQRSIPRPDPHGGVRQRHSDRVGRPETPSAAGHHRAAGR